MNKYPGPSAQHSQPNQYQQVSLPTGVAGDFPSSSTPQNASWIPLKRYPSRHPGQSYRGTRFDYLQNKWISFVNHQGRDIDIALHEDEDDAAIAHDAKAIELYGASSPLNFQYAGLLEPGSMRVHRLRTGTGFELAASALLSIDKGKIAGPRQADGAPPLSSSGAAGSPGIQNLGASRYTGIPARTGTEASRSGRFQLAPLRSIDSGAEIDMLLEDEWDPIPERAFTSLDTDSVANALQHNAGLAYEVVFPRAGPLGLNLRSYFAPVPAGARPGLSPFGCLEVLEAQSRCLQVVIEPGDFLLSVNHKSLSGPDFSFETAIALCSKAPAPRTLRFARMRGASAAELDCARTGTVCAIFDAMDASPRRLVTAHLHTSAPPFFYLNEPTRPALPSANEAKEQTSDSANRPCTTTDKSLRSTDTG